MSELTQIEREFLDEAVTVARQLGRSFLPREVLVKARQEGYALSLAFDPRFVKTGQRDERGRALWTIDESPERLQARHIVDIFSGISAYAERCYGEATSYVGEVLRVAHSRCSGTRDTSIKSRDELIIEYLQEQGWRM